MKLSRPLLAVVTLCAIALLMLRLNPIQNADKLILATHVWPGYELISLAVQRNQLNLDSIEFSRFESAGESMQALATGAADLATLTLDETLALRAAGVPIKVIHIIDVSHGADAVLSREPVQPGLELRGKRIAVESKLVGGLMLDRLLLEAGLQRSDLEIIELDDVTVDTWDTDVDLLISYEPVISKLLQRGAHKIYDSSEIPFTIIDVLVASEEAINKHPREVQAIVAGFIDGREIWLSNPMDSEYRLAAALEMAPEEVHSTFQGILLPDLEFSRHMLQYPATNLLSTCEDISQRQRLSDTSCMTLFDPGSLPKKRL